MFIYPIKLLIIKIHIIHGYKLRDLHIFLKVTSFTNNEFIYSKQLYVKY